VALGVLRGSAAQQGAAHIGYVYPAGGKQGTTFQVVVGGQRLTGPTEAIISGAGAQAQVVEYNRPMTQKEFNELRDEFRALQEKRRKSARSNDDSTNRWTTADEKRISEIKNQILKNAPNRDGNPAIAETVVLQITLAPDAELGEREVRIRGATGLSNPLMFCVNDLPEFTARAAKAANLELERFKRFLPGEPTNSLPKAPLPVSLPAIVNGQVMPGETDRIQFTARKGQRLVAAATARKLIPYLADAVPGWFQATLALYDARGKQLAYNDDFRFDPDPVLFYEVPSDGEYFLEIKDAIYRGREDFVYRITLGELPFITSIFPMGGKTGGKTTVTLTGWNLPTNAVTVDDANSSSSIRPVYVQDNGRISNRLPFATDTLPECFEQETNDSTATAQPVALPVMVNGRIDHPGDCDMFRFEGHAGQEIVAEVRARRLASPLDSFLKLIDANGKVIASNDDWDDKACGLETHHADSYLHATLPTAGTYYVRLSDTQGKGGPEYAYRLRLSAPQPDFELRIAPSSINVRAGSSVPLTVYAIRRDRFTNEIKLRLKDAPPGVSLSANRIPANRDELKLTVQTAPGRYREILRLTLEGQALIGDNELVHEAVPADEMMQAFFYKHLVPSKTLELAISDRGEFRKADRKR
jgi:hypothetical protein